jgi:PAS domain S-box-containing protein
MDSTIDERVFKLLVERVRDYAIFALDKNGCIASWNVGAALIKQYTAEEIVGKHFSVFYTPQDIERKWPEHELRQAVIEGRFQDEGWRVRKDGSRFWANVLITALRDEKGDLLGFSKITRDLTEHRRQQDTLRESEERFRLLVEGVQDYAIYMLSPEGTVTSWNTGARRIKGYTSDEIIGRHFSAFYRPQEIEAGRPWNELAMAREQGRAEDEGWRLRKDGTEFWARVVVTALHDDKGVLRGFAKVTQDLTQRRHAKTLEDSARRINDFIAVLAHELRNPLAPIRNSVRILEAHPGPVEVEMVRGMIDRQSAQLARIVDDLLDVTRVTRGTLTIRRSRQDVRDIIAHAMEAARPGIGSAKHKVELQIPEGELLVDGDGARLTQALTNILNNAARYTEPGGHITITVQRLGEEQPRIDIAVKDNGRGIEPHLLGSIFGMFVQGRGSREQMQSGLGIGLALARSIVELHHGTLKAYSEGAGKGSEFRIRIPALRSGGEAKPPAKSLPAIGAVSAASAKRILVVDDNADAATMLSEMLRMQGHEVLNVNSGAAALQVVEEFRPDVIMLDIGMPGLNGFDVARRLRERKRSPRPLVVAVTGWGKVDDEMRGREAGFDMHLVKPVEGEHLVKLFEQMPGTLH